MKKGDIRYTQDRKVAVVEPSGDGGGAIVQEIYVEDGKEFPAGPTFFAKDLTDLRPTALTWKGKQLAAEELACDKARKALEAVRQDIDIQVSANKEHLAQLRIVGSTATKKTIQRVLDFLAGDIRYIAVLGSYQGYEIVPFVEAITNIDTWHFKRYDGLKLLTLVGGRSNGQKTLNWNLNQYGDGSGSNTTVIPCKTKKEAIAAVQTHIDKETTEGHTVHAESAVSLGCKIPASYITARLAEAKKAKREYLAKKDKDNQKRIADLDGAIAKWAQIKEQT